MHRMVSRGWRGAVVAAGGVVLVATGLITSSGIASAAVGDITEYRVPTTVSSFPSSIAAGPDGNLWLTEPSADQVARVTTAGVFTEYVVPTLPVSSPRSIAAGSDGNLWFTEQAGNKVAKVTTSGIFTEYPVPTAGSAANGIVSGPDGNLWFTESAVNKVARVTTAGVFTEYAIPTAGSFPSGIAAGRDGNLWFTEQAGNNVAKVTTSGVVTEYSVPSASSGPLSLAAGPDGNLWFTEQTADKVAKVTASGVFTEYPVPTVSSGPSGIAAGPDGNLWFTESAVNKVARITTAGAFTEYSIPTASSFPSGIAAGPDGNLWFTEQVSNKVAKVTTAGVFTEYPIPSGANSFPYGIATGPDGNLWFTEYFANKLAKVTSSGVFSEYPLPAASSGPLSLAAGPDGNFWTTEPYANQVAKVTTSGVFTGYPIPTAGSFPIRIAAGPDGNLWFTELYASKVARVTTSGVITEYPIPTASSGPYGITWGPDGNLWFAEQAGNKVAKLTTSGAFTEYPIPTTGSGPIGIAAGPDGNLWITENAANKVAKVSPVGGFTEYPIPTPGSAPFGIAAGPDGNVWFTEVGGNKVARVTTSGVFTEYPVPTASSGVDYIAAGPDGNLWFTEYNGNRVAKVVSGSPPTCPAASTTPASLTAQSTNQYTLSNSDGAAWQEIDAANLRVHCTPTANQSVLLTANSDLWTANRGYNQDLGIFVSDNGGADQLLAWKESGGFAGTFSPNAAYVQTLYQMTTGHTYVFKLKWKTNKNAPGATIYAGAGPIAGHYSPTSLVAESFPAGMTPNSAVSTQQYTQANSDGSTWLPMDATTLKTTLSPSANSTAVLGAGVDLWTANPGVNQDIGLFVSDNGGAFTLVAWKESGGIAGTFSPNAAFVKATYAMTGGHTYVFRLEWKANKNAPGTTIYAGAGPISGQFSPTSLVAQTIAAGANPYTAVSTKQDTLHSSDGATWQLMDSTLNVTVAAAANTNSILGANADLFTDTAGYNQDLGIFVSDNGGADTLIAWKESGGFAGTFSPNAAFAQATYQMTAGHTYVFKLKWKTNKNAPGSTIYAGAGPGPAPFSPTRLTVELTNSAQTVTNKVTVMANPVTIAANGTSTSTVSATVTNPSGVVVAGDAVIFTLTPSVTGSCGTLSSISGSPSGTTNSSGNVTATYTASNTAGFCTITAVEGATGGSGSVTITQTVGGGPAAISVTVNPASVPADGSSTSTVTATVTTATGAAVPGDAVAFTASGVACGSLTPTGATTGSTGTAMTTYKASSTMGPCTITATEASAGLTGKATITQTAARNSIAETFNGLCPAGSGANTPGGCIKADGSSTLKVTANVRNSSGTAVSGDFVTFTNSASPSCGSLSASSATTDTNGNASVTYTASTTSVYCTITATEANTGGSDSETIDQTLNVAILPADTVAVTTSLSSVPADGSATSTVTVKVANGTGNVSGDPVMFSTGGTPSAACGSLSARFATTDANGMVTVTYTASTTAGSCSIAAQEANGAHNGSTLIHQTPFNTLTITATPSTIRADGTSTSAILVTVKDATGAPVAGDAVIFSFTSNPAGACGTLSGISGSPPGTTDANGKVTAISTASTTIGFCQIKATDNPGASGTVTIIQTS